MRRIEPGPDQESAWDYPRPPRVERSTQRVVITVAGRTIVDSTDAVRVLETSHPPVYYLPRAAFASGSLSDAEGTSFCEFKGVARYLTVSGAERSAWYYPDPSPGFEALEDRIAVYPGRMDSVTVDGEAVIPQAGGFYGGWITSRVVGPFKGGSGTSGW